MLLLPGKSHHAQVLAQALGGTVGPNPDRAFVLTIEEVSLHPQSLLHEQLGRVLQAALESTAAVPACGNGTETVASGAGADTMAATQASTAAQVHQPSSVVCGGSSVDMAASGGDGNSAASGLVDRVSADFDGLRLASCDLQCAADDGGVGPTQPCSLASTTTTSSRDPRLGMSAQCDSSSVHSGNTPCSVASRCFRLIESHGDQVNT